MSLLLRCSGLRSSRGATQQLHSVREDSLFTQRARVTLIAAALLGSSACRYRPTQITLLIDGDPDPRRQATITIATLEGAQRYEQLREALATPSATLVGNADQPLFGNTFSIIPKSGAARTGMVSMLAVYDAPATETSAALHIERMHQMAFVERVPQQGTVRFSSGCAARATDCAASIAPDECTVWRRCIEQGATCGDHGECVPWELALTAIPVGTMLDASREFDASANRLDASDASDFDAADANDTDAPQESTDSATDAMPAIPTRLIAPLSTSVMTSRRPRLRWSPSPDARSMDVDLCRNRGMTTGCQTIAAMTMDRAQPAAELEPGLWFWRVRTSTRDATQTSAVWQFRVSTRSGGTVDSTCMSELDFNGDGFSDIVVGAPGTANGTAFIFRSGAAGHSLVTTITVAAVFQSLGASIANAGDVNGDGLADIPIGAPLSDPETRGNAGAIRVHFGGNLGGAARVVAGDTAGDTLGRVVDGVGDVDGDGYADIVASAPGADSMSAPDVGAFTVYYGGRGGVGTRAPTTIFAPEPSQGFAVSVAGAGDVNGDGFADVIVGANVAPSGTTLNAGMAQIYFGSASGLATTPAITWRGLATNERFGVTVAGAGDVNGDGYCDVLVGSMSATVAGVTDVGLVRVFHGATSLPLTATTTINGPFGKAGFAGSISSAGDVNADGFADVIVGAQRAAPSGRLEAGSAAIYHGGLLGISPTITTRLDGVAMGDHLGRAVNTCGDVNNDGFFDVIVGAPNAMPNGAAYVFAGSATGVGAAPIRFGGGTVSTDLFGTAVASRSATGERRGRCALPRVEAMHDTRASIHDHRNVDR